MNASRPWALLFLLLPLAACGGESGVDRAAAPDPSGSAAETAGPEASRASAALHPCDAFPLEAVVELFGVAPDDVEVERGQAQRNETCEYAWSKADAEAIEQRNREALMRAMASGAGAASLDREPSQVSIFLTFHRGDFASPAEAVQALDQVVQRLEEGRSATVGDATFSVQSSSEPVPGIGEKAVWNEGLRQVGAVGGSQLFYVRVQGDRDVSADRARAEAVARRIASRL
jgi:hypothetical protein